MSALLITAIIIAYTLQSLFCKLFSDYYPGEKDIGSFVFSIVSGLTVAIFTFAVNGFSFSANIITILLAVFTAATLSGYNYLLVTASQKGPYSILMVFLITGGIIVPYAVSLFVFGEKMSLIGYLSIVLIIFAIYLVSSKKQQDAKPSKTFLTLCIMLAVCNGFYGSLLDIQQRLTGEGQKEELIMLTFLLTTVAAFVILSLKRKKKLVMDFKQNIKSALFLVLCSLVCAGAVNILTFTIQYVNITLLYTFNLAGVFLLSVLSSRVIFKEKLSFKNIIGCILIGVGLICITLF